MSTATIPGDEVTGRPEAPGFQPYVPDKANLPELTWTPVLLGSLLGIVFGASSLYLFLKVGMTVSASIPVAVLSITIFRGLSHAFGIRRATILENNIVQTAGSAGESIAFGVGAAMPALMLLGYELEWTRVMLVAVLGGLLGILMMIPLRRAFIVKQHGVLPYPEGTACAKVLIVGEQGGSNARTVFLGFGVGFIYQILMQAFRIWAEGWEKLITGIQGYTKAMVSLEPSPMLLGVGYIIGPRIASVMVGGGILASLLLVPMIAYFGERLPDVLPPGQQPISAMTPEVIWVQYVRYIGAGAVAAGGILSMINALPLIVASLTGSLRDLRSGRTAGGGHSPNRARPAHGRGRPRLARAGAGGRRIAADPHRPDRPAHRRRHDRALRLPVRHGQLADHRRDRLVVQPDLRDDDRHAPADLPDLRPARLGRAGVSPDGAVDRRRRLHRVVERGHDLAGPQDRLPGRRDALEAAGRDPRRGTDLGGRHGRHAPAPEWGVHDLRPTTPPSCPRSRRRPRS